MNRLEIMCKLDLCRKLKWVDDIEKIKKVLDKYILNEDLVKDTVIQNELEDLKKWIKNYNCMQVNIEKNHMQEYIEKSTDIIKKSEENYSVLLTKRKSYLYEIRIVIVNLEYKWKSKKGSSMLYDFSNQLDTPILGEIYLSPLGICKGEIVKNTCSEDDEKVDELIFSKVGHIMEQFYDFTQVND